jgi:hypothetical protein
MYLLRFGYLRIAVAEAQRQFGNPEEREHLLLEAVARSQLKCVL